MASGGTASPASDHSRRIAVREPGAPPPPPLGASGAGVVALGDVGAEAFVIGSVPLLLVPAGQGLRAPSVPEDPRKIHFASGRRCRRPGLTRRPTGLDRNPRDHRSRPRTSEGDDRNPQERPAGHVQMADYRQPGRGAGSPDAFNGYRHRCDHPRTAPGAPAASGRRSRWSRVASPSVITAPETISEGIADRLEALDLAATVKPCLRLTGRAPSRSATGHDPWGWCDCSRSSRLTFLLCDLDQVAARIVEYRGNDRPEVCWRLYESHTSCRETLVFGFDVVDREGGTGDTVLHKRPLERTDRGMVIRLKQQLHPLRSFLGYNSDPGVISQGDVVP